MALSDVIKKIEDSPRSTKVAVLAVGVAIAASAVAVFTVLNQADSGPEPASVAKAVTADQSPETQPVPTPTSVPQPTPSPIPTSTPEPVPTATPRPTTIPTPAATPTPEVNDFYVIIEQNMEKNKYLEDGIGAIQFHADYPDVYVSPNVFFTIYNDDSLLSYLVRERVITSRQKNDYFKGGGFSIPLLDISNAVYKMIQNEGVYRFNQHFKTDDMEHYLTYYADKSSVDSNGNASGIEDLLSGNDEGYVMISDGKISVSAVDADGNTTTVQFEGIGAKELLDYWLSQSKITVEQKNEYGQTGKIQFSLKDGVDLFDFGSSLDSGSSLGLDKESRDIIVKEILPLFKIGD